MSYKARDTSKRPPRQSQKQYVRMIRAAAGDPSAAERFERKMTRAAEHRAVSLLKERLGPVIPLLEDDAEGKPTLARGVKELLERVDRTGVMPSDAEVMAAIEAGRKAGEVR